MSYAACREWLVDFAEPILVLEMRRFRRSSERTSLIVVTVLLLILPMVMVVVHDQVFAQVALGILAAFYVLAILAFTASNGARSIQRERETGTWDMLVLTPLKSRQIVDQKMSAVAVPTLLLIAAGLPAAVIGAVIARYPLFEIVSLVPMLALGTLAAAFWSVEVSCDCGRAALWVAYLPLINYLCVYLTCGGLLVALALLLSPQVRGQAGRAVLTALCLEIVLGAIGLATMTYAGVFAESIKLPASVVAVAALSVEVLALVGMRCLLVWSIETWRRT